MSYCYVEFRAKNDSSLKRLMDFFELLKIEKESEEEPKENELVGYLTDDEKSYFWNPSKEEENEWAEVWSATPVDFRLSPQMPTPPWDLLSMLDAFWNGDYDLISIESEEESYVLKFYPHGYPYGGTASFVALIESFGHSIVGIEDGTGYVKYIDHKILWMPGMKYPFSNVSEAEQPKKNNPVDPLKVTSKPWWKFW